MSAGIVQAAYIVAAVLFIMSLAGLSKQERRVTVITTVLLVWRLR